MFFISYYVNLRNNKDHLHGPALFFFYGFWYYQMGTKCEAGMHVRVHLGKYGKTFFKKAESERVVVLWKEFVSDATEQEEY